MEIWTCYCSNKIWFPDGFRGRCWKFVYRVSLNIIFFHFVFCFKVLFLVWSDAAVDDIEIETGSCPNEASCDFEDDYCGYYNTKEGDDFDWERGKGQLYVSTGPSVDHTTGTQAGFYAFINPFSPFKLGDKAWLVSELISTPEPGCLNWYMNLHGTI